MSNQVPLAFRAVSGTSPPATIHRHVLRGCAPRPLAGYLKALGVLRIVAEQIDPTVRGFWEHDSFVVLTRLDEAGLLAFFLHEWQPSPFVSPWNKGSGLLENDKKGVEPLEKSVAGRFVKVREGISRVRSTSLAVEFAWAVRVEKVATVEEKDLKRRLQEQCRREWRGPALQWIRAAIICPLDGDPVFPGMFGTGGNDGNLDFTNSALQRLSKLFDVASVHGGPRAGAAASLASALFGQTEPALAKHPIGQFAPARSGGVNAGSTADPVSLVNPWDLPLLLEGALMFTGGTSRRLGGSASDRTVAPFSARSSSAGYGSAAVGEESARGEQWMPLWSRPWTAGEVGALLLEGRCQLGAQSTEGAVDVARAVARLGVARGVDAFERYGYMERNGRSNFAVPLGRWTVRAEPLAELVDDLEVDSWWSRLRRAARDARAPAGLQHLERSLADAVMAALSEGADPGRWQAVLLLLAQVEGQLLISGAFTAKARLHPLPRLSPAWIRAVADGGPELSLALALAGAGGAHTQAGRPVDSLRGHWLPLTQFGRFATSERGLAHDPRVVVNGRDAEADLIRIVGRRMVEGASGAGRTLPLLPRAGAAAHPADLAAMLRGDVDVERTLWLARALVAVDWSAFDPVRDSPRLARAPGNEPIDTVWAALRLCHLAVPLPDGRRVPVDPAILRALASGDSPRAFSLVLRRLRASGIACPLAAVALEPSLARRMAASLAFPISAADSGRLASHLDPHHAQSAQESRRAH